MEDRLFTQRDLASRFKRLGLSVALAQGEAEAGRILCSRRAERCCDAEGVEQSLLQRARVALPTRQRRPWPAIPEDSLTHPNF
jgi:hypothetical protein